jgi:hypothetical protein
LVGAWSVLGRVLITCSTFRERPQRCPNSKAQDLYIHIFFSVWCVCVCVCCVVVLLCSCWCVLVWLCCVCAVLSLFGAVLLFVLLLLCVAALSLLLSVFLSLSLSLSLYVFCTSVRQLRLAIVSWAQTICRVSDMSTSMI